MDKKEADPLSSSQERPAGTSAARDFMVPSEAHSTRVGKCAPPPRSFLPSSQGNQYQASIPSLLRPEDPPSTEEPNPSTEDSKNDTSQETYLRPENSSNTTGHTRVGAEFQALIPDIVPPATPCQPPNANSEKTHDESLVPQKRQTKQADDTEAPAAKKARLE